MDREFDLSRNIEDDDEIDLLPIFHALLRHVWVIVIAAVLCGALAFIGTKLFIEPDYQTSFTVYVNNKSESGEITGLTSSDVSASKSLATTYAEIITGRSVLLGAAEKCGLGSMSYKQLKSLVEAETSTETEIITVSVKGATPENALYLAQAVAQAAEGQISQIVDGSSMRVVDEPYLPTGIYSPNYTKNAIIGALLGMFAVCGFIVIKELADDRVKDEDTLESRIGIPVLGFIPDFENAERKTGSYYGYGYAAAKKSKPDRPEKPAKAVKTGGDKKSIPDNSAKGGKR